MTLGLYCAAQFTAFHTTSLCPQAEPWQVGRKVYPEGNHECLTPHRAD